MSDLIRGKRHSKPRNKQKKKTQDTRKKSKKSNKYKEEVKENTQMEKAEQKTEEEKAEQKTEQENDIEMKMEETVKTDAQDVVEQEQEKVDVIDTKMVEDKDNAIKSEKETETKTEEKEREAKPAGLTEPDPILKAFANVHTMEEALQLLDVSDEEKPRKSIAVESKIETDIGVMNMKEYGLKPTQKKDQKFTCAYDDCDEYFGTQGQLNSHLQTVHKATFKCPKCDKSYDTANGLNKHFHKHFKFTNICLHCGKTFQFPKQLKTHEGKHTDSIVGKYVCPTGGRNKVLLSKQGLDAHRKLHEEKEFPCDLCDKMFSTQYRHKQHQVGKHGNGTVAFCGRKFQWPDTKYKHQRECDACKEIKEGLQDKPDYPKPIFRRRKKKELKVLCLNRLNDLFCKYSTRYFGTFI